jgi:predicted metal-binding protein
MEPIPQPCIEKLAKCTKSKKKKKKVIVVCHTCHRVATRPKFVLNVNSLLSLDYLRVDLHQLEAC